MISITGALRANAQMRRTIDGHALLQFDVLVPQLPGPHPVRPIALRVQRDFGAGEAAAYTAGASALRLRRGTRVAVHGLGLRHMRGTIVLQGLQRIDELDLSVRNVTGERND